MYKCVYELTLELRYELLLSVKLLMFEQAGSVLMLGTFVKVNQRCLFQLMKKPGKGREGAGGSVLRSFLCKLQLCF